MTDLEAEIRAALAGRADAIDAAALRGEPVRRRLLWPMLAAAALVAALAVGSTVFLTRDRSTSAGSSAHFEDSVWLLVSVATAGDGVVAAPPSPGRPKPQLEIVDGRIWSQDSINFAHGRYEHTARGFRVIDATTTAAGYVGTDPQVLAAQAAISAIMGGAPVVARWSGGDLELVVNGFTARFRLIGRLPAGAIVSASSS